MREIRYKSFSLGTHQKNIYLGRASSCHFELTFGCGIHCRHCLFDCYNKAAFLKKMLKTKEVNLILNKLHEAGILWLCLTGGDPLTRSDFFDIYSYAKEKGFIITVFTNGYSMTETAIGYFKKNMPFVIEITLNAVTKELYEKISQVKGSFARVMGSIESMLKAKIPLKIKTQVTLDNVKELPAIKRFLKKRDLEFLPSYILYPRLNGDLTPCNLRVLPPEYCSSDKESDLYYNDCKKKTKRRLVHPLFPCAVDSGDGINLDPYGNIFLCDVIREPKFNLLELSVDKARRKLLLHFRKRRFLSDSECKTCGLKEFCSWCPGAAYLEKGDMEAPLEYYCRLAVMTKYKYAKRPI